MEQRQGTAPEHGPETSGMPRRSLRENPLAYLLEEHGFVGSLDPVEALDDAELASPASLAWMEGLTTDPPLPRAGQAGPTPPLPTPCPSATPSSAAGMHLNFGEFETHAAARSGFLGCSLPDVCSSGETGSSGGAVAPALHARRTRVSTRTPEERMQATREKNRRAQKNFRDRQKGKATALEQRVAELQQQTAALEEENKKLEAANAMRFKVAGLRGEQLERLQREYQVFGELCSDLVVHEGTLGVTCGGPCDASPELLQQLQRLAIADGVHDYDMVSAKFRQGMQRKATLLAELLGGEATQLGVNKSSALTVAEVQQQQLATTACHRTRLQQAVSKEVQEVARLCGLAATFAPGNFVRLFAKHPSASGGDAAEVRFWEEHLPGLQLSEAQEVELVAATSKHIEQQQALLEQRLALAAQLREALVASAPDSLAYTGEGAHPNGRERELAASMARCHELVGAMHAQLRKSHVTWLDFSTLVYAHLLAPWQALRIGNGPEWPDLTALGTAVTRRRGVAWTNTEVKEDGSTHRSQGLITSR